MATPKQTELLAAKLQERGLSIRALHRLLIAQGADVARESVRKWVVTGGGISDENKLRLCELLGLTVEQLTLSSVRQKGGELPPYGRSEEPQARPAA